MMMITRMGGEMTATVGKVERGSVEPVGRLLQLEAGDDQDDADADADDQDDGDDQNDGDDDEEEWRD